MNKLIGAVILAGTLFVSSANATSCRDIATAEGENFSMYAGWVIGYAQSIKDSEKTSPDMWKGICYSPEKDLDFKAFYELLGEVCEDWRDKYSKDLNLGVAVLTTMSSAFPCE